METKVCSRCKRELPADKLHFYMTSNTKDKLHSACKECEGHKFINRFIYVPKSTKICSKCKVELPTTSEYFYTNKNTKDGLYSACKECFGKYKPPKTKTACKDGYKICSKCKQELPATNEYFSKKKTGIYGLKPACKKCLNKANKVYAELNKEKVNERIRKYKALNRESINEKGRIYNSANKERYHQRYEANREKILQYFRERRLNHPEYMKNYREKTVEKRFLQHKIWSINNKDKLTIRTHKRDARKKLLPSNYSVELWEECKKFFNNKCAYCGNEAKLTEEHFIPLSKGGEYTRNNIIPVCKSCNSSKRDRNFFEYYPKQKYYSEKREQKILKYLNYDLKTKQQQIALCI
jgi:hypothetical protein